MGVVIRMNMAAGLGRAELSWAQAVVRNRCQLTHICRACWDVGVSGHSSEHLRDTVHLGPERSLAFSHSFTVSFEGGLQLSHCSCILYALPVMSTWTHTKGMYNQHTHTRSGQIQIYLAQRASCRLWSPDQRFWPVYPLGLWPRLLKSRDAWI